MRLLRSRRRIGIWAQREKHGHRHDPVYQLFYIGKFASPRHGSKRGQRQRQVLPAKRTILPIAASTIPTVLTSVSACVRMVRDCPRGAWTRSLPPVRFRKLRSRGGARLAGDRRRSGALCPTRQLQRQEGRRPRYLLREVRGGRNHIARAIPIRTDKRAE